MTSLKKSATPTKNLFFQVQTKRLGDPFKPLNSSLAQSTEELWHWSGNQKLLVLGQNLGKNISYTSSQSVNTFSASV